LINRQIILKKVGVNNLKEIDLTLPLNKLIVFTGVSGSGKSSLAFDTIYTEGQRRYIETLPHSSKRFLMELKKPIFQEIKGLSPCIAIEQKTVSKNPRSTVGTITNIYDYLRVLFAKIGIPHCPISHERVQPQTKDQILTSLKTLNENLKIYVLSPYAKNKKGSFKEDFKELLKKGFTKVWINEEIIDLNEIKELNPSLSHSVDIVIDRLKIKDFKRLQDAVYQALDLGNGFFKIFNTQTKEILSFSEYAYSVKSKKSYPPLQPKDFSFNHPSGMCEKCKGLGEIFEFDLNKIINPILSIEEDCCIIASSYNTVRYKNIYDNLGRIYKFNVKTPFKDLSEKAKKVFLYGTDKKWTLMRFIHPKKKVRWSEYVNWQGVLKEAQKKLEKAKSEIYRKKRQALMTHKICDKCKGHGLKPYPLACRFKNKKIFEITSLSIEKALNFFENVNLESSEKKIAKDLIFEITKRLKFLKNVGLDYLTLNRKAPTLSGGETQRVKLASQIGSGLIGTCYILDEPSIGLHSSDHQKLINTLKNLKDLGNTVIIVEHDENTIKSADFIVDIGPLAGRFGGEIVAMGSLEDIKKNKNSITGKYLSKSLKIKTFKEKKDFSSFLKIFGASLHNLKNVTLKIPINSFTCITGVSGSGKSSLISKTLYPAVFNELHSSTKETGLFKKIEGIENFNKVIFVDQSPIGKTPRSNPITYINLLKEIRDLLASLPESKIRGFTPSHFSFNVKEGSCPYCKGLGRVKMDMDFMEDVFSKCNQCNGKRFSIDVLSIKYKGKNIFDILEMEVDVALSFFSKIPNIFKKLKFLKEVGLSYLHLGQPSNSLSGGEAQRIKLSKELSKKSFQKTLYILDEPTRGLHFHDIQNLINILQKLVKRGNSVVIIEHNLDLIKAADYVIDLGPGAGDKGGEIIAEGVLDKILKKNTKTAIALKESILEKEKFLPPQKKLSKITSIKIESAKEHNLKNISLDIPLNKINVFTGPSGSGKTSLAFDTIYAEGQRRYLEALPPYLRQFLKKLPKPQIKKIENLSPCIAMEQKTRQKNPRSTVGTITEIYDHLRILYSHIGISYCPETNEEIKEIDKSFVVQKAINSLKDQKVYILSPISPYSNENFLEFTKRLMREGYLRIRLNKKYYELDEKIPYNKDFKNEIFLVVDRLIISKKNEKRLFESINLASKISKSEITLATTEKDFYFNLSFAVEKTGKSYPKITPQTFSFNSEKGMCLTCQGLGNVFGIDLKEKFSNFSISDFLYEFFERDSKLIKNFFKNIDTEKPIYMLSKKEQNLFFDGSPKPFKYKNVFFKWKGLNNTLATAAKHAKFHLRFYLIPKMQQNLCPSCMGKRLNPLACNVKIENLSLPSFCSMNIKKAYNFINTLKIEKPFLKETILQIKKHLSFLIEIGLDYLSLERSAPTLSGGEIQRLYLAKYLGVGLTNCLYILDEPTIGLHPYNSDLLIKALKNLKELNNTIIIVEHDPLIIKEADQIFDFGPKAGIEGGEIVAKGSFEEIKKNKNSLTGLYLSNKKKIELSKKRRIFSSSINVRKANLHNLKNIDVDIPKEVITTITGVSGSGKSTLINHILQKAIEKSLKNKENKTNLSFAKVFNIDFKKLIVLDQHLIGNTIRSDVSTYSEIMPLIRSFFASLPLSKTKGLKPRHFSYNHKRGMCPSCYGLGYRKIDLQFLPSVKITCDGCKGFKLNTRSLEIKYKNKHIGNILDMSVMEAFDFFTPFPKITKKLNMLMQTGLGYLKLGQSIQTLSGGEGQRLKLSKELSKRSSSNNIYLLDEPTIGLHPDDVSKLIKIFNKLVDKKNTLIIIEHNLDIIASSDYVIDLGPFSGDKGGEVIAKGTPEEIVKNKKSHTAKYLLKKLNSLR
jgi:excinuclease ABC subunit A